MPNIDELESQIAKICLGNNKLTETYAYVTAEKSPSGPEELYVIAELPLIASSSEEDCEKICLAISSTLKRAYKNKQSENAFENAIASINEELGKLAGLGQTQWVNKLNCILAVKNHNIFCIATCGKVSAYLLRNKEFTDISCSQSHSHPLKTFENYASGKIRLNDLLVLSTTQMFNYLSMDRLLEVVSKSDFLTATRTVIELLKQTAGSGVSFGILLNLQVLAGETSAEDVDLENYIVENTSAGRGILTKVFEWAKAMFALDKASRESKAKLPKISFGSKFSNFGNSAKNIALKGRGIWQTAKLYTKNLAQTADLRKLKQQSPQKKFLLISVTVLLLSVIFSLGVAVNLKNKKEASGKITAQLTDVQNFAQSAQSSLLYKDENKAVEYLLQAKNKLPEQKNIDSSNKDLYARVQTQIKEASNQLEKIVEPEVKNLGSLGEADNLIKLPGYMAVQSSNGLISYNTQSGKIEDGQLKSEIRISASVFMFGNTASVYESSSLYSWDFSSGNTSQGFSQNLPKAENFAGMAYYPTNQRVYVADRQNASITSFVVAESLVSKPAISLQSPLLSRAQDIAIDGGIYALTDNDIIKFQSGRLTDFSLKKLATPFSGQGKIYTQKDFANIYLLDKNQNRILVLNKKGSLVMTLKSDKFTKLKDFSIDEKLKIIYVLNDESLLKISIP